MDNKTSEEKYLEYVTSFISDFQEKVKLLNHNKTEILPEYLNKAMAEYGSHSATLVAEYSRLKGYIQHTKRELDKWYSKTFMDSRKKLINESTSSKTISVKEIEMCVKTDYGDTYYEYNSNIENAELKLEFIENLIKFWKRCDNILVSLSYNMRSEMKSLSIVNRANGFSDEEKSIIHQRRTLKRGD